MRINKVLLTCLLFISLSGCQRYHYYSHVFPDYLDTVITFMAYETSEDDFNTHCDLIEERLKYYDQLFDGYEDASFNNVKTINDHAGQKGVKVDRELIDVLNQSIERYEAYGQKVNVMFGAVTKLWKQATEKAVNGVGTPPSMTALKKAAKHTDIKCLNIDENKATVSITDSKARLDVGAVAKGYVIEAIKKLLLDEGTNNFLLNGGGNVVACGHRMIAQSGHAYNKNCNKKFCVGIASPQDGNYAGNEEGYEAVLVAEDEAVVTSGDYERYFEDDNHVRYHHLIDTDTLMPAHYQRSVTVVTEDSALADYLSSTLFLMSYEDGLKLVEENDDIEAIWLLNDGKIRHSSGIDQNSLTLIEESRGN